MREYCQEFEPVECPEPNEEDLGNEDDNFEEDPDAGDVDTSFGCPNPCVGGTGAGGTGGGFPPVNPPPYGEEEPEDSYLPIPPVGPKDPAFKPGDDTDTTVSLTDDDSLPGNEEEEDPGVDPSEEPEGGEEPTNVDDLDNETNVTDPDVPDETEYASEASGEIEVDKDGNIVEPSPPTPLEWPPGGAITPPEGSPVTYVEVPFTPPSPPPQPILEWFGPTYTYDGERPPPDGEPSPKRPKHGDEDYLEPAPIVDDVVDAVIDDDAIINPKGDDIDKDGIPDDVAEIDSCVFKLINDYRALNGLGPLKWNQSLYDAALYQSEVNSKKTPSHKDDTFEDVWDRATHFGYKTNTVWENILPSKPMGEWTCEEVFRHWQESDSGDINHRDNMLTPKMYGPGGVVVGPGLTDGAVATFNGVPTFVGGFDRRNKDEDSEDNPVDNPVDLPPGFFDGDTIEEQEPETEVYEWVDLEEYPEKMPEEFVERADGDDAKEQLSILTAPVTKTELPVGQADVDFMGLETEQGGGRVCFVLDASGSMLQFGRWQRLKLEVFRTIAAMPGQTRVQIILYSDNELAYSGMWEHPNKFSEIRTWLDGVGNNPMWTGFRGTFPISALNKAFGMMPAPGSIFFMTDGEFESPSIVASTVYNLNLVPQIPVHTITFGVSTSGVIMQGIARASPGGRYHRR